MPQILAPASTATLEAVKKRFKNWRGSRKHRGRIPDELWEAAAGLSEQYSVHCISRSLRLNYSALKDRIAARNINESKKNSTCFLELPPPQSSPVTECFVEMENSHGDKMRMHFAGEVSFDILALGQDFWRR